MTTLTGILLVAGMVILLICAVVIFVKLYSALKDKIEKLEAERDTANELAAQALNAAAAAEAAAAEQQRITAEANQTKADARTGDHSSDLNFMSDKLHEYAAARTGTDKR